MIDRDLLLTMGAMAGVLALVPRWLPPRALGGGRTVFDLLTPALLVGVLVGRVAAMLLEDPQGLTRPGDILILRGGAEFWPGVVAGLAVVAVTARRDGARTGTRLADLTPYALLAYGVYEAACIVRDGCFGPETPFGLYPSGVTAREFPVGLAVALLVTALALAVRRLPDGLTVLLVGAAGLAAVRAVAAVWLPRVGSGPTRQQITSAAVAIATTAALAVSWLRKRDRPRTAPVTPAP